MSIPAFQNIAIGYAIDIENCPEGYSSSSSLYKYNKQTEWGVANLTKYIHFVRV